MLKPKLTCAVIVLVMMLGAAPAALAQISPALRSAGVTEQEWVTVNRQVRLLSARAGVSENALSAIAERLGVNARASGAGRLDLILTRLGEAADQLRLLEQRFALLEEVDDPNVANIARAASAALDAGELDRAERLVEQGRAIARSARENAQLREAELIALQAQLLGLRGDSAASERLYGEAAETAPAEAVEARWRYRFAQGGAAAAQALCQVSSSEINAFYDYECSVIPLSIQQLAFPGMPAADDPLRSKYAHAADIYETLALPLAPRAERPADWAATQSAIGATARLARNFERSETASEAALSVLTREDAPDLWAQTQQTLGRARIDMGRAEDGVEAYDQGVLIRTQGADFERWMRDQFRLAVALHRCGCGRERGFALSRAAAAYQAMIAAAEIHGFSDDAFAIRYLYGAARSGLARTLYALGVSGDRAALSRSIDAAQRVIEAEARPTTATAIDMRWILARANARLGRLDADRRHLEQAIDEFQMLQAFYSRFDSEETRRLATQASSELAELEAALR